MRLIDADSLTVDYFVPSTSTRTTNTQYVSLYQIINAPTIIEFDGEINKAVVKGVEYYKPTSIRNFVESVKACSDCQEFDCYGCEHKEE